MTVVQILARVGVYGGGWLLTTMWVIGWLWGQEKHEDAPASRGAVLRFALFVSTILWSIGLGIAYWG